MYTSSGEAIGLTLTTVPAFLTKLWTLVDDASTDELICWDSSGKSFHVLDQARFAKEILPLYFKHNNIASFIRQLNMYGFRKIVNTEAINVKMEKDDMEFAHPFFAKDQEHLLEFIKRKVPTSKLAGMGTASGDDAAAKTDDVRHVLSEVNNVKGRQDSLTAKLESLKLENDVLWREVANLRQMHMKQQQVVNKLIQFLLTLVGNKRHLMTGVKRKGPLMLGDSTVPMKIARDKSSASLSEKSYQVQSPQPSPTQQTSQPVAGVVIDDVTELLNASVAGAATVSLPCVAVSNAVPTAGVLQPQTADQAFCPLDETAKLDDALEPLAVLEAGYPPSLQLTDVLEDETGDGIVASLAVDEILPPSPSAAGLLNETLNVSTSCTSLQPNSTRTIAVADSVKPPRNDIESHLDMTAMQLAGLRDLIACSPQLNIDSNVLELFNFNVDTVPMRVEDFHYDDEEEWKKTIDAFMPNGQNKLEVGSTVAGHELVQYMPLEDFSSLYDMGDESYTSLFDGAELVSPPSDPSASDDINDICLSTPRPGTVDGGRLSKSENLMEDVD